ncbi:hypothetical protein AKJ09_07656 [Labilithrix luteola]|uniref:Lipoprotein n=1 Tax=Labilithrix luteola TaxID=1391654 RepID=A0A0K1Q5I2_9BACT|nr:hypothetical protein [Labilithrix luteola]AKV00993.1 hypothetical protein AKJ09_07656 [Labilithrix luteola]
MAISRFAFFAAAAIGSGVVACQLLVGVNDEGGATRGDAATNVGQKPVDEAGPTEPTCNPVHPPDRKADMGDGGGGPSYMFAVRSFLLGPHGQSAVGYDLDDRCTGDPTVTPSDSPCTPYAPLDTVTDKPHGLDNAFGKMLEDSPIDTDAGADPGAINLNKEVKGGRLSVLINLVDYNGEADDDYVTAAIATSHQLSSIGCDPDASISVDSGAKLSPQWDGCDTWSYAPGTPVIEGTGGVVVPADVWKGYVVDHTLVAPVETLSFNLGGKMFSLKDAVLTGQLEGSGSKLQLTHALFTGRVEASELVGFASRFELNGEIICEAPKNAGMLPVIKRRVCDARDIPLRKADDGKGQKCNAVSFALGFDAEQARMGREGPAPPDACPTLDTACAD